MFTDSFKQYFDGTDVTMFPCLGNHDTWPVNNENFAKGGDCPAIAQAADMWAEWLGPEAVAKFKQFGYYSKPLELKDGRNFPQTKVIVLNTQAANEMNWYLLTSLSDPGNQIDWLENELAEAEKAG